MAARRPASKPRRCGETGSPSARSDPGPAEVAQDYITPDVQTDADADVDAEAGPARPLGEEDAQAGDDAGDGEDMTSGSLQDQRIYEGLEANRVTELPGPADPRRSRGRLPLRLRTASALRGGKAAKSKPKSRK